MKSISERELKNIILREARNALDEISNNLLTNASEKAHELGRREQCKVFLKKIAERLNAKYGIEDILLFYVADDTLIASITYDEDLGQSFIATYRNGNFYLCDTYYGNRYTKQEFEQNFAGDFPTPQRRRIMAGLNEVEAIMKKVHENDVLDSDEDEDEDEKTES